MGLFERIGSEYAYLSGALRALSKITKIAKNPGRTYPEVARELAEKYGDRLALISERERLTYRQYDAARQPICALGACANGVAQGRRRRADDAEPAGISRRLARHRARRRRHRAAQHQSDRPGARPLRQHRPGRSTSSSTPRSSTAFGTARAASRRPARRSGATAARRDGYRAARHASSTRCRDGRFPTPSCRALTIEDKCLFIYTSGTTGLPKAANINHYRVQAIMFGFNAAMRMSRSDRIYVCLPMYHTSGGVLATGRGADGRRQRRDPRAILRQHVLGRHRPARLHRLPVYRRALPLSPEQPDASAGDEAHASGSPAATGCGPTSGRISSGASASRRSSNGMRRPRATASSSTSTARSARSAASRNGWSGSSSPRSSASTSRPSSRCAARTASASSARRARSARRSRRSSTTRSGRASASRAMPIPRPREKKILRDVFEKGDRWFRTGDLMRKDALGYFYFVDRIGDTFRWKGENVATSEVSEAITVFPGIKEANVYGVRVPGAEGRAGMAALVVEDELDLEGFYRHVAQQLPAYARPVFLRIQRGDRDDLDLQAAQGRSGEGGLRSRPRSRDPIYFLHPERQAYVRLDPALYAEICERQGAALSDATHQRRRMSSRSGARPARRNGSRRTTAFDRAIAERFGALHARGRGRRSSTTGRRRRKARSRCSSCSTSSRATCFAARRRPLRRTRRRARSRARRSRPASTGRSSRRSGSSSTCPSCIRRRSPTRSAASRSCHALGDAGVAATMRATTSGSSAASAASRTATRSSAGTRRRPSRRSSMAADLPAEGVKLNSRINAAPSRLPAYSAARCR